MHAKVSLENERYHQLEHQVHDILGHQQQPRTRHALRTPTQLQPSSIEKITVTMQSYGFTEGLQISLYR